MFEDHFAWLEDVEGEGPLEWVRACNAHAEENLANSPRFEEIRSTTLEILDSTEKIPAVVQRGDRLYNFWTDADHERGIWRRTTWDSYRTDHPEWEVLIDVDALGAEEGVNWVWHGAEVLYPSRERALISLSRGGSDADVTREFDMTTLEFVPDGFSREESKGGMGWASKDGSEVFIFTDFGPGTMTPSGYPRTVRRWHRGQRIEDAEVVYEGDETDMYIAAGADFTPGYERAFVMRAIAFYATELSEIRPEGLVTVDVPRSSEPLIWRDWLLVHLRDDWEVGGATYPAGTLIATRYESFLAGERDFTELFAPSPSTSLADLTVTRHHVIVNLLDDVANRLEVVTPPDRADSGADDDGGWRRRALDLGDEAGLPTLGTIAVGALNARETDELWLTTAGFLSPSTLSKVTLDASGATTSVEPLKSLPAFFDATGMEVSQHFVISDDGTRVPYFQVSPAGLELDGENPTLLYGYGGFEIPMMPSYAPAMGRAWLARGGVYVVANIRGGGEYGPRWHQAALKEKRHRAYEDFAAVARDLVVRGVTRPERLGAQGGSNGGLLIGNMLVKYPELFGAVVCQVPLLDMRRFSHLLAGASWMAEYGDPDDPVQWEYIQTFSPYHQFEPEREHPPVLFTTSTRDDRVHPGHARKMAARMTEAGKDVTYYENIEGGHGGAATNAQRAHMQALAFEFLWQQLGGVD
ncbi:MAG: prolyl oligopeptidase family serine peptidase [Actinomycetota bacterium]